MKVHTFHKKTKHQQIMERLNTQNDRRLVQVSRLHSKNSSGATQWATDSALDQLSAESLP